MPDLEGSFSNGYAPAEPIPSSSTALLNERQPQGSKSMRYSCCPVFLVCRSPMDNLRWFWEIQRRGSGPHFYLALQFALTDAELEQWLTPLLVQDYDRSDFFNGWMHRVSNREWCFASVSVGGGHLLLTRGCCNDFPEDDRFLQPLLLESAAPLVHWRVTAGGDGYGDCFFRSGPNLDSLLDYCRANTRKPNFSQVLQQLKRVLAASEWRGKYTLGEPEFERSSMKVPVLYQVPGGDRCWQTQPADTELNQLAREVSDQCAIPASVSATGLHSPEDWYQVIGGVFVFGFPR